MTPTEVAVDAGDVVQPELDSTWTGVRDPARVYTLSGPDFMKIDPKAGADGDLGSHRGLRREFEVLHECLNIKGIPRALDFLDTGDAQTIVMERAPGMPLGQIQAGPFQVVCIIAHLSLILLRLAWRGVSQNDVRPENVLVSSAGCVSLVDFDQACRGGFLACLGASFLGIGPLRRHVRSSLLGLARDHVQMLLPPRVVRLLMALAGRPPRVPAPVLSLACGASTASRLEAAWCRAAAADASSPGRAIAYYELALGDVRLPGERSWAERWAYLRLATRWRGRRVLELGCNLALLSIFALRTEEADAALAVDRDAEILDAAAVVADAFEVRPAFLRVDFDRDPGWEKTLAAFRPDVVFALSVLNWVEDKARFLAFLARFDEVVFEGHESGAVEQARLRAAGFRDVELICSSERGRPVLRCRK